ncbi:hypothetical protein KDN34_11365 [Shewanella yunxiaonensis]|uniref:Uncharacterized protein n=1 Tax=Shewanella yunxiaonensis TaxID=2829809 RepID=A0ABX7YYG0_9GAMM|nr:MULTISPECIES: hypothetical protein [Shewanella]QUN07720.1 hypothetical protein KDN34_11365 [Shewanella yunxiaonensis]
MMVTLRPRASNIAAKDAAAMPLPSDETTPPVTKIYLVVMLNLRKRVRIQRLDEAPGRGDSISKTAGFTKPTEAEIYLNI